MIGEGWSVGSVTVRRVRLDGDGEPFMQERRHGGDLRETIHSMLTEAAGRLDGRPPDGITVTGPLAESLFSLPYLPESACVERALGRLRLAPDIVLSLGGESFVVYCLREGRIRNIVSSNRCAAGSGEFIVQQLGRMGLTLEEGLRQAREGRRVHIASRCSVHIKSDATHKLNKAECTAADIAHTLITDLAGKIHTLIASTSWPMNHVVVAGGLAQNQLLVEELRRLLPDSRVEVSDFSPSLEAYGAAVAAQSDGHALGTITDHLRPGNGHRFESQTALSNFLGQVTRLEPDEPLAPRPGLRAVLGLDAGSTTTKAALVEAESGRLIASCYLRTHGNPVRAVASCLTEIQRQVGSSPVEIIQTAVTGSGRDLVSVSLGGCLSFNEILAHARAARQAHPAVDTIFEIGGQDSKFVSLLDGIPVDYAMNDGCSAGTGSFLEEAAASDMGVAVESIGPLALEAKAPLTFGERCAAFINSEVRTAMQAGADRRDVLAGLVSSIANNYLSRVVGTRPVGQVVLLQGGVALNPAVAPAIAALSGRRVIVPKNPELMGCIGAALMAGDLLTEGKVTVRPTSLDRLQGLKMEDNGSFTCQTCANRCRINRFRIGGKAYPFGGLCSRWEMLRRPVTLRHREGVDLVGLRQKIMFETFAPAPPAVPRGRIGLPLALTTYELYPFYAKLLTELGFEVVLSRPGHGRKNTRAPLCYPAELLHAAVDDLLSQGVDWVFVPQLRELAIPDGHDHAYTCSFTQDSAAVIRAFFAERVDRILTPEIGLSDHLLRTTTDQLVAMAAALGVDGATARGAVTAALDHQEAFERAYRQEGGAALAKLEGPLVILVGRPYVACNGSVNLSLPRKIASRGFHVVPGDLLPFDPPANRFNVWHFTQTAASAIRWAKQREDAYVCTLSTYSCNPDAITHHRLRHELEGRPFCFLEVDSHTADAGIDTRVGAFLDIIESRPKKTAAGARVNPPAGRIDYSGRKPCVITSDGQTIGFDHPRVRHVLLADIPVITSRLFVSLYGRLGWRTVTTPFTNSAFLQAARRVCSGRECLPFLSMVGKMVLHLQDRDPDEVTLFHLLGQEGPCQIGDWFDATALIFERLGARDAFPVWPRIANDYLGGGEAAAIALTTAVVLGDLVEEMRSSLRCLASDPEAALKTMAALENRLVAAAAHGVPAAEMELRRMRRELAAIPRRGRVEDAPKVLLFSGINRIFTDKPIRDYLESQGILAKTADIGEFLCVYESEPVVRAGFAAGRVDPDDQFSVRSLLAGAIRPLAGRPALQAARASLHVAAIEYLDRRWRALLTPTGLVYAPRFRYRELLRAGHRAISCNSFTEAPFTVGRYLVSLEEGAFDGFVNVGAFNCLPASVATAATHSPAIRSDRPYAVIESDGATITASQRRQLEAVAAQVRAAKGRSVAR